LFISLIYSYSVALKFSVSNKEVVIILPLYLWVLQVLKYLKCMTCIW